MKVIHQVIGTSDKHVTRTHHVTITGGGNYNITIIKDGDQFAALRHEWNQLGQRCSYTTVFQTWEWLFTWWRVFGAGRALYIILVYDEHQRLAGIGPFYIQGRCLRLIGDDSLTGGDFLDVIAASTGVVQYMVAWLKDHLPGRKIGVMLGLRNGSPFRRVLEEQLSPWIRTLPGRSCPVIQLPETHAAFLEKLGRRTRRNIRYYERRLYEEYGFRIERLNGNHFTTRALRELVALQQARRERLKKPSALNHPKWQQFHDELTRRWSETDAIRFYRLVRPLETVAVCYCLTWQGQLYFYQAGFDENALPSHFSLILVLLNRVVKDGIAGSFSRVHLLDGNTPFKQRVANDMVTTETLMFARSPAGWAWVRLWAWCHRARHRVSARVPEFLKDRVKYVLSAMARN